MFKDLLDFLSDNIIWVVVILIIILPFMCSKKSKAECITHTVQKGESLAKISKQYYGDRAHWKDIKYQNDLKRNWVKEGQELQVYVPGYDDWGNACGNILYQRLQALGLERPRSFIRSFIAGIELSSIMSHKYANPMDWLKSCRWAIATAEQESMYEFAIGGAGEVGTFQFKLDTVRLTGRWYKIENLSTGTDRELVKLLTVTDEAVAVFVLHFRELHRRYKNLWIAWKRYNNGSEAAAYASKAIGRYNKIRRIKPMECP